MRGLYHRIIRLFMILSFGILPGSFVDCDWEDGEFKIDFDELELECDDCDDGVIVDFWGGECVDCW